MKQPILIAGPTASGKSALALALAKRNNALIVNADALQVYDAWQVLTARPSNEDLNRADHALYGHVSAAETYSVGRWLREVKGLLQNSRPLIIVGGTGLYFTALTEGLAEIPETPPELRARGNALMQEHGLEWFREVLSQQDPATLSTLDPDNPVRLQRAWEVLERTGKGLSAWHAETPPPLLPLSQAQAIALRPSAEWLNARIAQRFAQMLDQGAIEEVEAWRDAGHSNDLPSAKALGRAEISDFLDGTITREEATSAAVIATRQYAKRQRTWMRNRLKAWPGLDPSSGIDAMVAAITQG
ncbi:MAG: tRNA (adenosine(37)-N6)-dimethylallyltransferase MiaA [Pseudomonadota bacterium]